MVPQLSSVWTPSNTSATLGTHTSPLNIRDAQASGALDTLVIVKGNTFHRSLFQIHLVMGSLVHVRILTVPESNGGHKTRGPWQGQ